MDTGVLRNCGYFMGDRLNPANATNLKGQFEDTEVNSINENLLAAVVPQKPAGRLTARLLRTRLSEGQRWLNVLSHRRRYRSARAKGHGWPP